MSANRYTTAARQGARPTQVRGSGHPHAILDEARVLEIRQRFASGETQTDLAAAFGVDWTTVRGIVTRRAWVHVGGPVRAKTAPVALDLLALIREARAALGDDCDPATIAAEVKRRADAARGDRRPPGQRGGRPRTTAQAEKDSKAAALYAEGLTYRQIGAALGLASPGSVHKALARGLADLVRAQCT